MLALVPLLVPVATAAATGALMLLLLMALNEWWLPQQPSSTTPRFHYFTRFVKWSKAKLSGAVLAARRKIASALSNAVARRSHGLVLALNNATEIAARLGDSMQAEAEQTYRALYALRHVTLPEYVQGYVRPIVETANTALATARGVAQTVTDVSIEFANGLRALPWGVPLGLPARVATFFTTYKRLWDKVWDELGPRVTELWTQIVPELRQRLEALERGAGGGIGGALQGLRNRIEALERQAATIILPRIGALEQAVDALAVSVLGDVGELLRPMLERITELERQVGTIIPAALDALRADLAQLRTELEQGIETGLEAFRQRFEALEIDVFTNIPQRLAGMQLAIDTLAAEVFEEVGAGLTALTTRIVAIEQAIQTRILPGFDLILGRIEALETQIRDDLLPRLRGIEDLLAPAAFAALVLATLRTAAPNLFCRNVTEATRALCRQSDQWLDDLLALGLPILVLADLCAIARAGRAVASTLEEPMRLLVLGAGGAFDCADIGPSPDLPLRAAALPAVSNPIAL